MAPVTSMRLLLVVGGTMGCDAAADMCKVRSCVCAAEVRHLGEIFYRGGLHKVVLRTSIRRRARLGATGVTMAIGWRGVSRLSLPAV